MSRIRLILLSLFAVFAVSAVASASASAEVCGAGEGGGDVALCIEKEEIASPGHHAKIPVESKIVAGTVATLTVTGGPIIVCKKADDEGEFDRGKDNPSESLELEDSFNPEISDLKITFTECEVSNAKTKCEVTEPIVAEGGGDNLDARFKEADNEHVLIKPSQGTVFTKITIKAKAGQECVLAITEGEVTGEQECELPGAAVEKVEHEVKCNTTGSKLKFAGKVATFSVRENVKLVDTEEIPDEMVEDPDEWSIIKS
jgi:hypothetical protein